MARSRRTPTAAAVLGIADWPHRIGAYEAFGQRYAVWTSDAALAEFLHNLYAPMAVSEAAASKGSKTVVYRVLPPEGDHPGVVLRDHELIGTGVRPHQILGRLQWAVNRQVIENGCADRLILHAGGVVTAGQSVLLPAEMESGKTTLTTGLLDRGFGYLSDEAVAVAPDLSVEGYAKPLSIDRGSWDVLRHHAPAVTPELQRYLTSQWQVPAASFAPVLRAGRVAALVFPSYLPGGPTSIERLGPADAVMQASRSTFIQPGTKLPVARVRELAAVVARVPAYRLLSGDLEEACEAVAGVLTTAATEVAPSMLDVRTAR